MPYLSFLNSSHSLKRQANQRKKTTRGNGVDYQSLEPRKLLAGVSLHQGEIYTFDQSIPIENRFEVLTEHLQLESNESFRLIDLSRDQIGFGHLRYQQHADGIPVEGAHYSVHAKNRSIASLSGHYIDFDGQFIEPADRIGSQAALESALAHIDAELYFWDTTDANNIALHDRDDSLPYDIPDGELVYYSVPLDSVSSLESESTSIGQQRMAYKFDVFAVQPLSRDYIFIDVQTGEVLGELERLHPADVVATGTSLYNGNVDFTADFTGTEYRLRQSEHGVETYGISVSRDLTSAYDIVSDTNHFTGDDDTTLGVQVHFAVESTLDYFQDRFGRDSIDGNGSVLRSYVNYATGAFAAWNGSVVLVGSGTTETRNQYASLDLLAHEITHGITENTAALNYDVEEESSALNQSFSDIFGEAVEHFVTGSNDWLVGDEIGVGGSGGAFRNLSDPHSLGHRDTYRGYLGNSQDLSDLPNYNAGVQNRWFYLLTEGETGTNRYGFDYDVDGIGIDDAAAIAYRNLTVYLTPNSNYQSAHYGSTQAAIDLFGENSQQHLSTIAAWDAVNVMDPVRIELPAFHGIGAEEVFASQSTLRNFIQQDGPYRSYVVELESNQELSARVVSEDGLTPFLTIIAPDGSVLGTHQSGSEYAVVNSIPVDTTGEYEIRVEGTLGSFGEFTLDVMLNGSFESESLDGVSNDTPATAIALGAGINPSSLGSSTTGSANRVVVAGNFEDEGVPAFEDDFESGNLGSMWTTNVENDNGMVEVTDAYGADSGSQALFISQDGEGSVLVEAILELDTTQIVNPILEFSIFMDAYFIQFGIPDHWIGSSDNGSGVAVSSDGSNWYSIFKNDNLNIAQWNSYRFDLTETARSTNFTLGSNLFVKFQTIYARAGKFGFDSIKLLNAEEHSAHDWYSFDVDDRQPISLTTQQTVLTSGASVDLYDDGGNLLISGSPTQNFDNFIDQFVVDPGTYYARVNGYGTEKYTLTVARGLKLNYELANDDLVVQRLEGSEGVLGGLGLGNQVIEPDLAGHQENLSLFFPGVTLELTNAPRDYQDEIFSIARHDNGIGSHTQVTNRSWANPIPTTGSLTFGSLVNPALGFRSSNNLRVNFLQPQAFVSIEATSPSYFPVIGSFRAFDSNGILLNEVFSDPVGWGETEIMSIRRSEGDIAYIVTGGEGSYNGFSNRTALDHLQFSDRTPDELDVYELDIQNGQVVDLSMLRIGSQAGRLDSGLTAENTQVSLYAPDGTLITMDPDAIRHTATATGTYRIEVSSTGSGSYYLTHAFSDPAVASLEDTHIFYDDSFWDVDSGGNAGAIATDKSVFLTGQTATYANYTNSVDGITGVMVDINSIANNAKASDFEFRVGATDDTSSWTAAPEVAQLTTQFGSGANGSDRVALNWQPDSLTNTWLQVTVLANSNTGLAENQVFYFGNVVADTGDDPTSTRVDIIDVARTRFNQSGFFSATIENSYDINRDSRVDLLDVALIRNNQSGFFSLPLITPNGSSNRNSLNDDSNLSKSGSGSEANEGLGSENNLFSTEDLSAFNTSLLEEQLDGHRRFSSAATLATLVDNNEPLTSITPTDEAELAGLFALKESCDRTDAAFEKFDSMNKLEVEESRLFQKPVHEERV